MNRQVGEVSEGLVLDLSVQSKRAAEVREDPDKNLTLIRDFLFASSQVR